MTANQHKLGELIRRFHLQNAKRKTVLVEENTEEVDGDIDY